jgi:ABC-type transporter Mla subunit MlaD
VGITVASRVLKRPKSALNWVDFLVIGATALVFLTVAIAAVQNGRKSHTSYLLSDTAPQSGLMYDSSNLARARINLATGG